MNSPFYKVIATAFSALALFIHVMPGLTYELRTHERMTGHAFDLSQQVRIYLNEVGINPSATFDFENRTLSDQLSNFVNTATPRDWMIEGSIREDDFRFWLNCDSPRNPPTDIDRPLNHFFDVQRGGRGLTVTGAQRGFPAPDWGLGRQGQEQNHFSILNARDNQLKSLTEQNRENRDKNTALLFRTLGHVVHLLQDMAQPQHTRNDPHAGCFPQFLTGDHSWYEDYIEARVLGTRYRERSHPAPPLSFGEYSPPPFTIYRDFWTATGHKGLADFSSRNFFSAGTNFQNNCDGLNTPLCNPSAYGQSETSFSFQTVDGKTKSGLVTFYLGNVVDQLIGQTYSGVRLSSRSAWDQHLERKGLTQKFSLNTFNYDDMSELLLPRAVGYSAGLLDYFFRGKLDVDLFPDPINPSVLELKGTNGSPEALVDGTLALYSDGPDGTRTAVPALNPLNVANIAPGQEISSRFEVSQEAERFIAVYQGTLGNEVKDPANNFPGAVIGKVLGGVRVEQVFSDGTRWHLRTPKGIFPLPILVSDVVDLRWGDRENTLVGRSQIGPNQPNLFYSFEVRREPGSLDVILRAPDAPMPDQPPGTQVADLITNDPIGFPSGIESGTTVHLSQTIDYKNVAVSVMRTETQTWDGPNNNTGQYRLTSAQYADPRVHTFHTETQTLQRSFPVTFAFNTFCSGFGPPYCWFLQDTFLNSQGDILALVAARPAFINQFAEFSYFRLTVPPGGNGNDDLAVVFDDFAIYFLSYPSNMGPILWALLNVSKREIIASTAPQEVTLHHSTAETQFNNIPNTFSNVFQKTLFVGGPQAGQFKYTTPPASCTQEQRNQMQFIQMGQPIPEFGFVDATVNQYRPEIAQHQLPLTTGLQETATRHFITCGDPQLGIPSTGFEVTRRTHQYRTTQVAKISRRLSESGADSAIFLMEAFEPLPKVSGSSQSKLIRWVPGQNEATLRRDFSEPGFLGEHSLRSVSDGAVLVRSTFNPSAGGPGRFNAFTLVPLEQGAPSVVLEGLNPTDLIALNPGFLYHVRDLKFYSKDNLPRPTALPATLAAGGAISFNDFHYHTVRVP